MIQEEKHWAEVSIHDTKRKALGYSVYTLYKIKSTDLWCLYMIQDEKYWTMVSIHDTR